MALAKINILSGCPQGGESGSSSSGGEHLRFFKASSLQELLKAPFCPHVGLAHILVRLGKQGGKEMWRSIKALEARTGHNWCC